MDATNWNATTIAAIIALCGVAISASVAYVTASRSVYVNAITTARIRWIESVRKLVAELRDRCIQIAYERSKGAELKKEIAFDILRIGEELRLTLGRGPIEKNINMLATLCANSTGDFDAMKKYVKSMSRHTQYLLESEWKRVKSEAGNGILKVKGFDSQKQMMEYKLFCESEGSFPGCEMGSFKVPPLPKASSVTNESVEE